MPKVSVVMPAYNAEKFINETIDSVLDQTFCDFEFIIINDCSTDDTEQIIQLYSDQRIKYIKNDFNSGIAKTFNKGLDIASGEYIARIDADDICMNDRIEKQVNFLDRNRHIGACGGAIHLFGTSGDMGVRHLPVSAKHVKVNMLFNMSIANPSSMMRANIINTYNLRCDPDAEKGEDYDFWVRFADVARISNLPDVLVRYRIHPKQSTVEYKTEQLSVGDNVRKRLLKRLINNVTEAEFEIYNRVALGERNLTTDECHTIQSLFKRAINHNKQLKLYDANTLKHKFALTNFYIKNIQTGKAAKLMFAAELFWTLKKRSREMMDRITGKHAKTKQTREGQL